MLAFLRRRRRRKLSAHAPPAEWRRIAEANIPSFARLSAAEQTELLTHARILLHEKHWEGSGGLELTEAIRVTIAVQAARLLLGNPGDYFPNVRTVLIYPSTVAQTGARHEGGGVWSEHERPEAGLATGRMGVIVLAWDSVRHSARTPDDGYDVVLHEFAHALDFEEGHFNGAPALDSAQEYRAWARALQPAFEQHQRAVDSGAKTLLDAYGAINPAEFFAVLTETFFERPMELKRKHPGIYDQLRHFYRQDPARPAA
jgi:Mlc titration factor MtfA (ptsG expression regulator)